MTGTPVPALAVPTVDVTRMTDLLVARLESTALRVERAALTEDTDADGANVVLADKEERKVVLAVGREDVAPCPPDMANKSESLVSLPWEISRV